MNKSFKIYLILLGVVIVILTLLEMNKSEIIDWRKDYNLSGKNPFGLYIFNQEANALFNNKLRIEEETPYVFLNEDNSAHRRNYLFINNDITAAGLKKIMEKVQEGDNAFFIVPFYTTALADTLGIGIDYVRYQTDNSLRLLDPKFAEDTIYIDKLPENIAITDIDTLTTQIIGTSLTSDNKRIANFVNVKHGKGNIFLHVEPLVLTNYYLLQNQDYKYVEHLFSYLPDYETIWFTESVEVESQSIMRFILSQRPLRYAWYLFLLGLLLFAFFTAKRRQRQIPIIEPKKNSSAEFVQMIGNLYLQEGNYKDMAKKKATYFLNKVRSDLHLDTHKLDATFIHKLQLKTGVKLKTIEKAMPLIEKALHSQAPVQEKELIELNDLLDEILHNRR